MTEEKPPSDFVIGLTWRDPTDPNNYAFVGDGVLVVMVEGKMLRMRPDTLPKQE